MAIDFHAHLARDDPGAPPFLRHLFDVEGYVERQAEAGVELTVLSHALSDLEGGASELDEARAELEFLTEVAERHPGRFAVLAGIDPFGGPPWLEQARRALDLGCAGFCFPTSHAGRYLDSPEAQDALALANDAGALVFVHPSESPITAARTGDPVLEAWIGLPYDTGICLSRLLLADTLAGYPELRLVAAHAGGALPMVLGRLDHVLASFERRAAMVGGGGPPGGPPGPPEGKGPTGGDRHKGPPADAVPDAAALEPSLGDPPPSERVGQLYLDTASYHPAAVRAAIAAVGADHVVFGSDYPPVGESPRPMLDVLAGMGLTPDEEAMITTTNARRLLGRG